MALFDFKDSWIIIKYHQEFTDFEASLQHIAKEECLNICDAHTVLGTTRAAEHTKLPPDEEAGLPTELL